MNGHMYSQVTYMKILPMKAFVLYLAALALFASGCSSKTARDKATDSGSVTGEASSGGSGQAEVPTHMTPEETVPLPTQDPMSIPGNFIEFSPEKLRDLGGAPGITRSAQRTEARFSGKVFDSRLDPSSELKIYREIQYPDGSIVEEVEKVQFSSAAIDRVKSSFEVRITFEGRRFKLKGQNICERYHSPTELHQVNCSRPEIQDNPSLLGAVEIDKNGREIGSTRPRANENLALHFRDKLKLCTFSPESPVPEETRQYGAFVVTPGLVATESERHITIHAGKVVCVSPNGERQESPAQRQITVVRSYDSPSLLMPQVGQGLVVFYEDVIQTPERVISRTTQRVGELIR